MITLAFDIYGTLINPVGITEKLQRVCGDKALPFARLWREKQLEYTFRRGLMKDYRDFSVCVSQALQYTASSLDITLDNRDSEQLLALYLELPAFSDAEPCLKMLDREHFRICALSNGRHADVQRLLEYNGLDTFFENIISVDAIKTFKPDPAVYHYFLEQTGSGAEQCWLISSNPFDVIGAMAAGFHAAWIQRDSATVFDPWETTPDLILPGLEQLQENILNNRQSGH